MDIKEQTIRLIDELKATCANYGMGNDGNEYKIITQVFLYKFLNDKFGYEIKNARSEIAKKIKEADKWEVAYAELSDNERMLLQSSLSADVPILEPYHLISNLWNQQSKGDFDTIFDNTMTDIAEKNADIFSTQTTDNTKIPLFETLTNFVTDTAHRADFARALVDKLVNFSFEGAFEKHYDFFASIFEYLIKDYNTAGGGKYAEYYTPHAIATIMARLLVGDETDLHSQECYDPSAGTGTLLMALSHQIGEDRCTIFSQDISQRSNKMLKLNLLLNGLVSSLDYAIQGDTLVAPYHKSDDGQSLRQFDFVVSNPPFKMDFSGTREKIAAQPARFWAGVPNIPAKKKESMAIYTCFIQHVINSLKDTGKGAIVIPTGFITAKSGIEKKILKRIVDERLVYGCVSMPSNVFANTGTNVSVLFFDKSASADKVVLIDASKLGEEYKESNNQKKRLRDFEVEQIVTTFRECKSVDDFSVCVSYEEIKEKGYSLSAGQYFDIKIEYVDITEEEFNARMSAFRQTLTQQFAESHRLEEEIMRQLDNLKFNENVRLE
ncbi:MAG: SAM-dependent DNA methyltransferase [Alloprevotella tannerae]|jgi:putative type I restriction-modification system, M subunit|uniref:HsdM family class I SAM-dependent methyltransferase n=1 Tax=Alloprevotella tannerae TaxID=76122 RepID=UPI001CB20C1C|nr:class I SAM-dependent DNA methyltransferase [Alloprevotella tannerae]MBF0950182.1 SAM-dependent DNA methyltransferase [Alloprevotella tannerae]MBF0952164.1 SAM-dependent DNA methyltransferase [Alloprevotella tannerae]